MSITYLTKQGSYLTKTDRRILIKHKQETLGEIKCEHCSGIVIFGNIQISSQVMSLLFASGISTTFLTCRGKIKGQCVPVIGKNIPLRHAQFKVLEDKNIRFSCAKRCTAQKINNTIEVLKTYSRLFPMEDTPSQILELEKMIQKIPESTTRDELMGIEGYSAKVYFGAYAKCFKGDIVFPGRKYFPSCDPINALLSLTYTLVGSELFSLLQARGLDPYLGFLHENVHSRPSLSLDLLEPFRQPLADRFVLTLFNRKEFQAKDFMEIEGKRGLFLTQESMKVFLNKYDHYMKEEKNLDGDNPSSFRDHLKLSIEAMASWILNPSEKMQFFEFSHRKT